MANRRCLYLPDELWSRLVKQVARDQEATGERITVSAWVRAVLESHLEVAGWSKATVVEETRVEG